ncbi:hypothetical protein [Bradyrhizobium diversitatis]|uniref:hypothetical protein n=1 Tax=Bradyrhizobium diversitatis TaxID=2755406 RepID=UPI001FE4528D|nr:hypothetical protein [Bradyrhizobium diversitatis]
MKFVEPASCSSAASTVFVGRNRRGDWVAREQNGIFGGLFANRAQAFKYALFENGHHSETVVEVSYEIELDLSTDPAIAETIRVADTPMQLRRVECLSSTKSRSPGS